MKRRFSVPPGYPPEFTRPMEDPAGVGNNSKTPCPAKMYNSEIYSYMVVPNIYIIKFISSNF